MAEEKKSCDLASQTISGGRLNLLESCCSHPGLWDEIIACLKQVFFVITPDGEILFASPQSQKTLGYAPEELEGQNISLLFTPEDMTYLYPNLLFLSSRQENFDGEIMLRRCQGDRFFAAVNLRPCSGDDGQKPLIFMGLEDISRQKEMEKTIKETHNNDLARVADGIAHEIRNPLMGIGGFINRMYKAYGHDSDGGEYYDYIMNNLKRIENLVKKVEVFARLPRPAFALVRAQDLAEEAITGLEGRKAEIKLKIEPQTLVADRSLLKRVLGILLANGLDSIDGPNGKIEVRGEKEANTYRFIISDNGKGIRQADLPHIFEPFFTTKPDGAGLDLAVAKRIMELHDGRIEAGLAPGRGASFTLTLPMERRRALRVQRLEEARENGQLTST